MGRLLRSIRSIFSKKAPDGVETIRRWVYKFNKAQAEHDVRIHQKDQYGKPGEEVWSEEEGFYQYDWEKAANAWHTTKELGNYWFGPTPEKEGESLPADEYKSLLTKFTALYDLD
jgi:hypothetical protein